ncbi:MAG TPA: hypothetical protein VFE38_14740 [Edaphobacter sp.]|nr:hypothetical protein [Edaphobacter sp.]
MSILHADTQDRRYQHGSLVSAFITILHKIDDLSLQTNHLGCRVQRCALQPEQAISGAPKIGPASEHVVERSMGYGLGL